MTELTADALAGSMESDDQETDASAAPLTKIFLKRLVEASWPFRHRVVLVVLLNVARAVCLGAVVYFINDVTSALLSGAKEGMTRPMMFSIAALLVLRTLSAVAQFLAEEARRWFEEGVEVRLLEGVLENLCRLPADYFETRSLPGLVVRLDKLQEIVRAFIGGVVTVFVSAAAVLGLLGGMIPTSPILGAASLIIVTVVSIIAWRRTEEYQDLMRQEYQLDANLADLVGSMFKNPRDLHNYGLLGSTLQGFDVRCAGLAARALRKIRLYTGIAVFLNVVVIGFMTVLTAGVVWWNLEAANAIACFAAVAMSLQPLSELVRSKTKMLNRITRMGKLLARTDELSEGETGTARTPFEGKIQSVRAKNLWYHRDKSPILQDLNFELRTGEILGVIGRSGAGKTSLANVLLGLSEPSKGKLAINRLDIRELDLASLWKQSAYITQLPCHSGGDTLVDEVALVRPEAPLAEIYAALEEAGIDRQLWQKPLIAEDWRRDAGMDWRTRSLEQQLEWARVILRDAKLVVLDEPTSMVGEAQEDVLTRSLLQRKADRITILISHRERTLAVCDRVLVLQGGRQAALGTKEEILTEWLARLSLRRSA